MQEKLEECIDFLNRPRPGISKNLEFLKLRICNWKLDYLKCSVHFYDNNLGQI